MSHNVHWELGYWRFCFQIWRRETAEKLHWWVARKLPRKTALLAFVRVCAATGEGPSTITYESAHRAWERGAGK